jgi:hypothetical protein
LSGELGVKTFFTVKFALMPLAVFIFLAAYGLPLFAVAAGLVVSIIVAAWRLHTGEIKYLELAVVVLFCALAAGIFFAADVVRAHAVPLAFVGLAAYAAASVVLARPWSAEFSRTAYPKEAGTPGFFRVNMILSALWAILFIVIAVAEIMHGSYIVRTAIVIVGAAASIFGPKWLARKFSV